MIKNTGFCGGTDSFDFTIIDINDGLTDSSTVRVTVNCVFNNGPIAVPDIIFTLQDESITFNVLDNDLNGDGTSLMIEGITGIPTDGLLTNIMSTTGIMTYIPNIGSCGQVELFEYRIIDNNGMSATSTININVICRYDPCNCYDIELTSGPTITFDRVCYGYRISKISNSSQCTDIDYFVFGMNNNQCLIQESQYDIISISQTHININKLFDGLDGSNVSGIQFNGDIDDDISNTLQICFDSTQVGNVQSTAMVGFKCSGSVAFSCNYIDLLPDFCGGLNTGFPPIANDDRITIFEGNSININVLNNDYDPNGGNLKIDNFIQPNNGLIVLNENNNIFTYTPDIGFCGDDSFIYTISVIDGDVGSNDNAMVHIEVICNDYRPRPKTKCKQKYSKQDKKKGLITSISSAQKPIINMDGIEPIKFNKCLIYTIISIIILIIFNIMAYWIIHIIQIDHHHDKNKQYHV